MLTIYSDRHALHYGKHEMFRGEFVPCVETPPRADHVLQELERRQLGAVQAPDVFEDAAIERVHAPRYLQFLAGAWNEWIALDPKNAELDALPSTWAIRTFRSDVLPISFHARLGLFSYDTATPLMAGTFTAARAAACCALTAAKRVLCGQRAAFALARPPGHHAGSDFFGGYCYLNNAAIAAQALRDAGVQRVSVLDIDYHHGNGTQAIFYERADVQFLSLHGDPLTEYPFYTGHADEQGSGAGLGFNHNLPLPRGTDFVVWREALAVALCQIAAYRPGALVVSLGLDTFERDPISGFKLTTTDFLRVGEDLARAGLPTVFVFEGGYAIAELGINTVHVLDGFMQGA